MKKAGGVFGRGSMVVLKSVKGAWSIKTELPNGRAALLEFNEGNEFCDECPTELGYIDFFGDEVVFIKNYAQTLIDSYNKKDQYGEVTPENLHLEVVSVKEVPTIVGPVVKVAPISKRKVKQNEEVS